MQPRFYPIRTSTKWPNLPSTRIDFLGAHYSKKTEIFQAIIVSIEPLLSSCRKKTSIDFFEVRSPKINASSTAAIEKNIFVRFFSLAFSFEINFSISSFSVRLYLTAAYSLNPYLLTSTTCL